VADQLPRAMTVAGESRTAPGRGGRVSPRRAVVGLVTACAVASVMAARGLDARLLLEVPFVAALVVLAAIDLERRLLPNRIVYPLAAWGIVANRLLREGELVEHLAAGAAAFVLLLVPALVYPAGMGMGDAKLAGAMGLHLAEAVVPALIVAFSSGTLAGVLLMVREGAAARKRGLPFGVFLAIGGLVGVLAGRKLLELYTEAFLGA
jgi:leader peptidase (prepilin peptidase) / N-methyltransferase